MLLARNKAVHADASNTDEGAVWMPVSDLMAGLMMLFLLLSVVMMLQARAEADQAREQTERVIEVAEEYRDVRKEIYEALKNRLGVERLRDEWKATLDPESLSVEFVSPVDVAPLFTVQENELTQYYRNILSEFFPVYLSVLQEFEIAIEEIRIEGHTSSEWLALTSNSQRYFKNMELSQQRAKSVLEYVYNLIPIEASQQWMQHRISAVGLSSSKLVLDSSGLEDPVKSRRVTFRILTNADAQIDRIRRDELL